MSSFILKIIAIVSMLIDHVGIAYFGHFSYLNLIGRFAFPIFAFQISEGFLHTKNLSKYFFRLAIFAAISQIPFSLFNNTFYTNTLSLNIFFTLLLGLLAISIYDYFVNNTKTSQNETSKDSNTPIKYISQFLGICFVIIISIIAELINTDYGYWGVLSIFSFYIFKDSKLKSIISFAFLCIIKYGYSIIAYGYNIYYILLGLFTILSIIFIGLYNGKQGKKIKYLFYLFYPIHLILLYILF